MTLKNIKIRVPEGRTWQEVVSYLESLGYKMISGLEHEYENKAHYYGNNDGRLTQTGHDSEHFFKTYNYEEIFLPELLKAPPIGLRPKAIVDALRIQEILEAMTRYVADGKAIPQDWIDELSIRNSERIDYAG